MFWNAVQAGTVNAAVQRFVVALGGQGHSVLSHMAAQPEFAAMIAHYAREKLGVAASPFLGHGIPAAEKGSFGFWNECPAEKAGTAIFRFLVALEGDADAVLDKMKSDPFFISRMAEYAKAVAAGGAGKSVKPPGPALKEVSLGVDVYTYFLRKGPVAW